MNTDIVRPKVRVVPCTSCRRTNVIVDDPYTSDGQVLCQQCTEDCIMAMQRIEHFSVSEHELLAQLYNLAQMRYVYSVNHTTSLETSPEDKAWYQGQEDLARVILGLIRTNDATWLVVEAQALPSTIVTKQVASIDAVLGEVKSSLNDLSDTNLRQKLQQLILLTETLWLTVQADRLSTAK